MLGVLFFFFMSKFLERLRGEGNSSEGLHGLLAGRSAAISYGTTYDIDNEVSVTGFGGGEESGNKNTNFPWMRITAILIGGCFILSKNIYNFIIVAGEK